MTQGQLWLECTDENGDEFAIRWASVTDEQLDDIAAYAERVIGRRPDTIA